MSATAMTDVRGAEAAEASARRSRWHRRPALHVTLLLAALEAIVFGGYFTGASAPPWDAIGHYNTEAFAWWRDGSFFSPTQWLPYAFGGYPSTADVQNSSWYLPVGVASWFHAYDLRTAAVVSALHVAFGALGVYCLGRMWRLRHGACTLGLVTWFFASGFYAHAEHLDIMRAYAWVPWFFVVASPRFPWRRWWAPLAAAGIAWQGILAIYPGTLAALAYVLPVWTLVAFHRERLRTAWRPIVAAVASAGLGGAMAAPRFLTAALTRGVRSPTSTNLSVLRPSVLGTLLFPYGDNRIPNDISMRSFFLPATTFVLLLLAPRRSSLARAAAAVVVVAGVLGAPPLDGVVRRLPGLSISRFVMSDFLVSVLLGLTLLAMVGADRLLRGDARTDRRPRVFLLACVGVAVTGLAAVVGPYPARSSLAQVAVLALAAGAVVWWARPDATGRGSITRVLVALAATSGLIGAFATTSPWRQDRAELEGAFGHPVSMLIASRSVLPMTETRRPARELTPNAINLGRVLDERGGASFYSGSLGLFAYVNLKGVETYERVVTSLTGGPDRLDARAFWSAPGLVIAATTGLPAAAETERCVASGDCGNGLTVSPVSYDRPARLLYRISTAHDVDVILNEASYRGWTATACVAGRQCRNLTPGRGTSGEIRLRLPAATTALSLDYRLPGLGMAWSMFTVAALLAAVWSMAIAVMGRARVRRRAVP